MAVVNSFSFVSDGDRISECSDHACGGGVACWFIDRDIGKDVCHRFDGGRGRNENKEHDFGGKEYSTFLNVLRVFCLTPSREVLCGKIMKKTRLVGQE